MMYMGNRYCVLDFETTNIDKGDPLVKENRILLTGVLFVDGDNREYVRIWGDEYDIGDIVDRIYDYPFMVNQNSKFELQWLERAGLDLHRIVVYDTMIGKYVWDGNRFSRRDLDSLCAHYNVPFKKDNVVKAMMVAGVCPSEIPAEWLEEYCKVDVLATEAVFLKQRQQLLVMGLLPTMFTRCLLTPALADIEKNGMQLDKEGVDEYYDAFVRCAADAYLELQKFSNNINWRSSTQRAEFLYNTMKFKELKNAYGDEIKTDAGKPKTDIDTIMALKATNKRQRAFTVLYKRFAKADGSLTKYLKKFKDCCDDNKGNLQFKFNQTITKTHRLSSTGKIYKVQGQNFNRNFKCLFTTRHEGWELEEQDGAQLEFRVAGYCGSDLQVNEDLINDVDIHANTAAELTAAGQETERQGAKEHSFKPLYGGESGTEAEKAYYKFFKERYSGVAQWQEDNKSIALDTGKNVTATGLIFYYPGTKITKSGYITNSTNICNYPVQSLATADIIPIAIVYMWHRLHIANLESFIVNTVHDSIILERHPEEKEAVRAIGKQSFTYDVYKYLDIVYNIKWNIPLGIGTKSGKNWGDGKEVKVNVDPPYKMVI